MQQAVDVLAVMDRAVVFAERTGSAEDLANARESRAAVAEMIEASRVIDERIAYYASLGENAEQNIEGWAYTDSSGDMARYRAALARVSAVSA